MTTEDILQLSLDMAGLSEVPADTAVYLPGKGIRRVLVGIDLEGSELVAAKAQGFDLALAHHPAYLFTAETQRTQRQSVSELNPIPRRLNPHSKTPLRTLRLCGGLPDTLNMYTRSSTPCATGAWRSFPSDSSPPRTQSKVNG
jgi:hypothetical protein